MTTNIVWYLTLDNERNPVGYEVVVESDDGREIHEHYYAGNHSMESTTYVPFGSTNALPQTVLENFAQVTARSFADTYGVPHAAICRDYDAEAETTNAVPREVVP